MSNQNSTEISPEVKPQQSDRPAPGNLFLVRCSGFRCLAYKDKEGRWRNAHHGDLLPGVLEILSQL